MSIMMLSVPIDALEKAECKVLYEYRNSSVSKINYCPIDNEALISTEDFQSKVKGFSIARF